MIDSSNIKRDKIVRQVIIQLTGIEHIIYLMGSWQSSSTQLDPTQWVPKCPPTVPNSPPVHPNPYAKRTLLHLRTHECIEEYQMAFSTRSQLIIYRQQVEVRKQMPSRHQEESNGEWSYGSCPYLYPLRFFIDNSSEDLCSTSHKALVYAQRVALRLTDLQTIPFSDQVYLLSATLQGFKVLYEKMGFFNILEQMVFFDERGRARVWMHPNIASARPFYQLHQQSSNGSQSDMIVSIIEMIEDHDDPEHPGPVLFSQHLRNKGKLSKLSFYMALKQLKIFCLEKRLHVPSCVRSVAELFSDEYDCSSLFDKSQVIQVGTKGRISHLVDPVNQSSPLPKGLRSRRHQAGEGQLKEKMGVSRVSQKSYRSSGSNKKRQVKQSLLRQVQDNSSLFSSKLPYFNSNELEYRKKPTADRQSICSQSGVFRQREHSPIHKISNLIGPEFCKQEEHWKDSITSKGKANSPKRPTLSRPRALPLPSPMVDVQVGWPPGGLAILHKDSGSENAQTSTHQYNSNYSESTFSFKQDPMMFQNRLGRVNYYTANNTHQLDEEIAQDMEKYLGYNPSQR